MAKKKKTIDNLEVGDVIVWGNKHGATQTGKIIDISSQGVQGCPFCIRWVNYAG